MSNAGTKPNRIIRTPPRAEGNVTARASVIKVERGTSSSNQSVYVDEWAGLASSEIGKIVLPTPYDVVQMFKMIETSAMLPQCIDAMVTNTVGTGWEAKPRTRKIEADEDEQDELESFIDRANADESLSAVMKRVIEDRESVGFGFLEVIRDRSKSPSIFRYAPAISMRLTPRHKDEQLVEYEIPRGKRTVVVKELKRFRRYVQIINGIYTYFKEFGDPRSLDAESGMFKGEPGYKPGNEATEIVHFRHHSNDPYGLPQWINQVPSMIGSREADEVNMRYFEDNMVPPIMMTVAGGRLTSGSYQEVMRAMKEGVGKDRQNQFVLIEAVGDGDSLDGKSSAIQVKVEKLSSERPSDGLFKEYQEGGMAKLRSSFRLPPVAVGMSQDANFATANVSQFVAESQVFAPARQTIDEQLNNTVVNGRNGLNLKTVKLVARTPSITSPEQTMKSLTALNVMGAVTPRSAQLIANTMLQMELPPFPEKGSKDWEEWMDQPMPLTIKESGAGGDAPQTTHGEQASKDPSTKAVEGTGDVSQKAPEHGQE